MSALMLGVCVYVWISVLEVCFVSRPSWMLFAVGITSAHMRGSLDNGFA